MSVCRMSVFQLADAGNCGICLLRIPLPLIFRTEWSSHLCSKPGPAMFPIRYAIRRLESQAGWQCPQKGYHNSVVLSIEYRPLGFPVMVESSQLLGLLTGQLSYRCCLWQLFSKGSALSYYDHHLLASAAQKLLNFYLLCPLLKLGTACK